MSRRPHALYIAWGFPPSRGSGVHRALATANNLVAAGFDVTVVTCDRETFLRYTLADTELESQVHPAIEVVRVPFAWPLMEHDLRRWSPRRAWDPIGWREQRLRDDVADYPEVSYGPWREPLVAAVLQVHERRPVDLTVATANPNVDIEAAHQLYLRAGVPFVMDQRDAWTLDTFAEVERGGERERALEAAYIRDATEVWFVNEPLRDWHAERNPGAADHIHSVLNGFDAELAPAPKLSAPDPAAPLTFGYVGTITSNTYTEQFLAGWVRAREIDEDLARARADLWGYLGFYVNQDKSTAERLAAHRQHGVRYLGPVPKTEVRQRYLDFDALLLLLGTGRFVTSGKVFEYMASALPIVSVHSDELAVGRILADYPLWFRPASMAPDDVAEALVAAGRAAREADAATRRACLEHALSYDRRRILEPRLKSLLAVVEARQEARL